MNKKLKLFAFMLAASVLAFTSCKKDEPKKDDPKEPASSETMYIMGTYDSESFLMTNDQIHYFRRTDNKVFAALDMAVRDNGDVYVVGELDSPLGTGMPPQSALYKNNEECSEYTLEASVFCGIAFKENGDIVLAGLKWGEPAVWDGTNFNALPVGSIGEVQLWDISSIEYTDGNEFIVGSYMSESGEYTPVAWMNRQLIEMGQMDSASTFAFAGALTNGTDFKMAGIHIEKDEKAKAFEYNSQQQSFTQIPYQWSESNVSMTYGIVKSSKWGDASSSIYSLVTEYYAHGYVNPKTGEIGAVDTIRGGFYVMKDGQVMPQTIYQYPKENTLASIIDMTMNSKGQIVTVGTLYDNENQGVRPAYWIDGECHIINPDRLNDDGTASRVIIKNVKKDN